MTLDGHVSRLDLTIRNQNVREYIMWRASRRLVVECLNFFMRCGRVNPGIDDLDDIADYDIQDVPVYFQPQMFEEPVPTRPHDDLQHRPDAPCMRRRSPPEVVTKMLQAIDEMNETKSRSLIADISDRKLPFEPQIHTSPSQDQT